MNHDLDERFATCMQQLQSVLHEMGSKGGVGDDPAWIQDYTFRLREVTMKLEELARARPEGNPSHRSYP